MQVIVGVCECDVVVATVAELQSDTLPFPTPGLGLFIGSISRSIELANILGEWAMISDVLASLNSPYHSSSHSSTLDRNHLLALWWKFTTFSASLVHLASLHFTTHLLLWIPSSKRVYWRDFHLYCGNCTMLPDR